MTTSLKIGLTSDIHMKSYYGVVTEQSFNKIRDDINSNKLIDLLVDLGDSTSGIKWDYNYIKAKFNEITVSNFKNSGNHEHDEYNYWIQDKDGSGIRWTSTYPHVESTLNQPITSVNQTVIKLDSVVGFSSSESMIVAVNDGLQIVRISYVSNINSATNEITLTQGFGYNFPASTTKIMQGRDVEGIRTLLKSYLNVNVDSPLLSHSYVKGNNLFVFISEEDYYNNLTGIGMNAKNDLLIWLENQLSVNQDKNIFVFSHYSVMGTGISMTDGLGVTGTGFGGTNSFGFTETASQSIKNILSQYKVCGWFSGHVHLLPMESGVIQYNTPSGWNGCTFIHCPSSGGQEAAWGQVTPPKPYWRMLTLTEGSQSALVKTRDSDLQQWLNSSYNITFDLVYPANLGNQVYLNNQLPFMLNSVKIIPSSISLPIYSDTNCTVKEFTLGKLGSGQIHIIDRYLWNNTSIPIAVQLYDQSDTNGIISYSWDGTNYADPSSWKLIQPDEKVNFKVKVDLTTVNVAQSFLIGKRVRAVSE